MPVWWPNHCEHDGGIEVTKYKLWSLIIEAQIFGCVTLGKLLNILDLRFFACKMGVLSQPQRVPVRSKSIK